MKKLNKGEKQILKSCAVRHDLTENDMSFIKDRVEGKIKDPTKYRCPKCRAKFIHFDNAVNHMRWYH